MNVFVLTFKHKRFLMQTDDPTEVDQIMFAVKTCSKYHKDRVPALKQTWTRYVQHLRYFSDVDGKCVPPPELHTPSHHRQRN